jgi:histidine triad (HIT) family protein
MEDCIFCAILEGRKEASFVYRDESVSAFMDIRPINPGHILVVPNMHTAFLADLDPEAGGRLFKTGQRLAIALRNSRLRCEGVNFFLADGEAAHQEIFHVHLHVFPRYKGDGFRIQVGSRYDVKPSRASLDSHAAAVKKSFKDSDE